MNKEYLIWEPKPVPGACSLCELEGVEDILDLNEGLSRLKNFPEDARYPMDPDFPNNTLLTDNLINSDMLIVVSEKLKDFLQKKNLKKVEFLPVNIINHKKKPASKRYYIANPVDPVDCLDTEKSGATWSRIDKQNIQRVAHLVIDPSKIENGREFFRPKYFYRVTLASRELAEAIDAAGFSGIRWKKTEDYPFPINSRPLK